jgi:hypothetical protein
MAIMLLVPRRAQEPLLVPWAQVVLGVMEVYQVIPMEEMVYHLIGGWVEQQVPGAMAVMVLVGVGVLDQLLQLIMGVVIYLEI